MKKSTKKTKKPKQVETIRQATARLARKIRARVSRAKALTKAGQPTGPRYWICIMGPVSADKLPWGADGRIWPTCGQTAIAAGLAQRRPRLLGWLGRFAHDLDPSREKAGPPGRGLPSDYERHGQEGRTAGPHLCRTVQF